MQDIWKTVKGILRDPAMQGIGTLLALLGVILGNSIGFKVLATILAFGIIVYAFREKIQRSQRIAIPLIVIIFALILIAVVRFGTSESVNQPNNVPVPTTLSANEPTRPLSTVFPTTTLEPIVPTLKSTELVATDVAPTSTKTIMQTPTSTNIPPTDQPIPTATPAAIIFRDDFNEGINQNWKTLNANYTTVNGVLAGAGTIFYPLKHTNVRIKVKVKSDFIAIYFRQQYVNKDTDGYYIGIISKNITSAKQQVAIRYEVVNEKIQMSDINIDPSVDLGLEHEYELIVVGVNATLKIDGNVIGTFVVGKYNSGEAVGIGFAQTTSVDYFEAETLP